ncbi:enoyl-CoA hydratase/isomerase family protein [Saccharopolyspora hattusasensis]|uniref:enoyl-CoA hydratase/isomerase family protein n=1 Tax=Saccharopolyspora hattusasensis TaxID=1128679 RepID=UPI003D99C086
MTNGHLVDYQVDEHGVAVLMLNNPPLNLNTLGTIDKLLEACRTLTDDDRVRVVVVTGAGDRAFCAGSDISEFAEVRDDVVSKKLRKENCAFTAIEQLPQPVVAALNGSALGGGAEIALACDIRIIDEQARIGFPEVNLGVFPGSGGVFRLPRIVGVARAYELLYTGEPIDAAEAYRIGLVNSVASHGDALESALKLARTLASKPALALSLMRAAVRESVTQNTAEATQRTLDYSHWVFTGPDIAEGVAAFFEKRAPRFTAGRRDHASNERTS